MGQRGSSALQGLEEGQGSGEDDTPWLRVNLEGHVGIDVGEDEGTQTKEDQQEEIEVAPDTFCQDKLVKLKGSRGGTAQDSQGKLDSSHKHVTNKEVPAGKVVESKRGLESHGARG